jgi:hypothetical protein
MKIKRYLLLFAIGIIFTLSRCEFIVDPIDVTPTVPPFDTTKRVALVEEWTGHICTNCPDAARTIEQLKAAYGPSFIAISIHDNYFAMPCTNIPPNPPLPMCAIGNPDAFQHDFRCATGASYSAAHVGASDAPPTGMVNRLGMPSQTELRAHTAWSSLVDSLTDENASTSIHIVHDYNPATRALNVQVWGSWMQSYSGTLNIAIMLTEGGITGWQIDDQSCDQAFVFHDILRECLNTPGSIAGTQVATGTSTVGTMWSYVLPTAYTVPANFNPNECSMVAILYDTTTGEVIQAWKEEVQ